MLIATATHTVPMISLVTEALRAQHSPLVLSYPVDPSSSNLGSWMRPWLLRFLGFPHAFVGVLYELFALALPAPVSRLGRVNARPIG